MIQRHWKGIARPTEATNYIHHLTTETFPQLAKIEGFIKASILTRDLEEGVEFLIVTEWQSMEAIKQFAGEQIDSAVVPDAVQDMMLSYDSRVYHYTLGMDYKP